MKKHYLNLAELDKNAIMINTFGMVIWTFLWLYCDIGSMVSVRNTDLIMVYWGLVPDIEPNLELEPGPLNKI